MVLVSPNSKFKYFDQEDIPMDLIKNEYEQSIGKKAINALKNRCYIISQDLSQKNNKIKNKKEDIKNEIIVNISNGNYGADYVTENKNNMKRRIRLTESDLHKVIKESVNTILKEYTRDYGIPVKNRKLYALLHKEGLDNIILCKGYGYFYITSDDDEMYSVINELDNTTIYVNSFNQLTPEEWVEEIKRLLNQ